MAPFWPNSRRQKLLYDYVNINHGEINCVQHFGNVLLCVALSSPPPCRRYGLDRSLSVSFKLRLLLCCVAAGSGLNKHYTLINTPVNTVDSTRKSGSTNGFVPAIHEWIVNRQHSKVRGDKSYCSGSLDKHGAFLNVSLGSADCTSARLGMSRSVDFNRAN